MSIRNENYQLNSQIGYGKIMKYLSLFTGIGGFELGIQQAYEITRNINVSEKRGGKKAKKRELQKDGEGLHSISGKTTLSIEDGNNEHIDRCFDEGQPTCIGFSEIDKYATQIYQQHFPEHKNYGDIKLIDEKALPDFDLLVGGFPCQSFSIAGKRGGFADTRGTLFFDIARILKQKQPRLCLLENVKGLLSHDEGRTFRTIIATLDELGYDLQWQVLNSKNFGVPQNRERVFIIGHLRGTPRPKVFPFTESIGGHIESGSDDSISRTVSARFSKGVGNTESRIIDVLIDTVQSQRIRNIKGLASTLSAGGGGQGAKTGLYGVEAGIRRLTPKECERLQGFPDGWTENGLSDIMEVCVNINPAIEKQLLELGIVSNITSDGKGMVFPTYQSEKNKCVSIVLEELVQEDGAINIINLGNAMATLFNRKGILLNATELKENLTYGKTVEKCIYKLWKVRLVGHYEKEKLSTILTWINETMQSITSISARTDENIIGVIIHWSESEQDYLNWESLSLRMGNINTISDTQRYKCLGNAVTVNVVKEISKILTK